MKVVRKGNVYKKVTWLEVHRKEFWYFLCTLAGFALLIVTILLSGGEL